MDSDLPPSSEHSADLTADSTVDSSAPTTHYSDLRFLDRLLSWDSESTTAGGKAPAVSPPVGPLGDYDLVKLLGQGGMGMVYEARHCVHGHVVALKTMWCDDPAARARLKREFRQCSDVVGPHLVTLYELCVDGPCCFFTMELVRGVDFLAHVGGGPGTVFDEPRLRAALPQLIDGVSALHEAGRLHRDVKPSNIMVREDGQVVLIDYGLAVEMHAWRSHGSFEHLAGTLSYMAPERFRREPVSPASDWYSVGVVLYRVLTGQLPYPGNDWGTLHEQIRNAPPAPAVLNPDAPEDLSALCMNLLAHNPADRLAGPQIRQWLDHRRVAWPTRPNAGSEYPVEPFVGRADHLARMKAGVESLTSGQPSLMLLAGRSGVGKSTLLRRFLASLQTSKNVLVLAGRCLEQERVPFKAWDAVIESLIRHLHRMSVVAIQSLIPLHARAMTRVFPAFGQIQAFTAMPDRGSVDYDQHELRRRAILALRELLCRLGNQYVLVLAVDDAQWGDEDSIDLLEAVLRPPDPPTLLYLVSYRIENQDSSPFTRRLLDATAPLIAPARQITLSVEELSPAETEEFVVSLLEPGSTVATSQVAQIVRESEGNPFFVRMLVRHQLLGMRSDRLDDGGSPGTLDQVLLGQMETLLPLERRLLEVVSLASGPLSTDRACRTLDISPAAGQETILTLRIKQWLRTERAVDQESLEAYHDRIREVVVRHLPAGERKEWHRRLATVLEDTAAGDLEQIAIHWSGADEKQRAGQYFAIAADQAGRALAFHRAAVLYHRSLDLLSAEEAHRLVLRKKIAEALALAGRGAEAAGAFLAAAQECESEALALRQQAAEQYLKSGNVDVGLEVFRTVLQQIGEQWPTSRRWLPLALLVRRGRLWLRGLRFRRRNASDVPATELTRLDVCWTVYAGLSLVDQVRAAYFQVRGLHLALRAGEPFRVARAIMSEATHIATAGPSAHRRVAILFDEADKLVRESNTPQARGLLHMASGIAIFLEGRWHAARGKCVQAVETLQAECPGTTWEQVTANTFLFWSLTYHGRFAELRARFPACWNDALARGDRNAELNYGTYSMILLRLCEDDEPRGTEELRCMQGQWVQQGFHVQHLNCLWSRTKLDLYAGRAAAAWQRLELADREVNHSFLLRIQVLRVYHRYLRGTAALAAASQSSRPAEPLRRVSETIRLLGNEDARWARALGGLLRAGLAARGEDRAATAALYRAAADELAGVEMDHLAAAARYRQGQFSDPAESEALCRDAITWMRQQAVANPEQLIHLFAPCHPP
ncbi:serine/threonine-protein kinase [Limnoglobus roseus]|uniref:Protein kinase domain-containing protein n=1 Tax=Limnoglobus roseus TaxID=2598579 RepID=A0A5C1A6T2_9BACT|nr:serine/threonine-protein kinase [Limnoglobus roseus]QEL13542.1 hypothetical protein PX52LOC_00400 [Limnoglobus roseus]